MLLLLMLRINLVLLISCLRQPHGSSKVHLKSERLGMFHVELAHCIVKQVRLTYRKYNLVMSIKATEDLIQHVDLATDT